MLRLAVAVAAGILIGDGFAVAPEVWLVTAVSLCVVLLVVAGFKHSLWKSLFPLLLVAVWMAIGAFLPTLHSPADPFPGLDGGSMVDCHVRLCDTPRPTPKCYKVTAEVTAAGGQPARGKVLLYIRQDSLSAGLCYGDCLSVQARPRHPENRDSARFDYRRFLHRKGILWQCYVPSQQWQKVEAPQSFSLRGWAKGIQSHMVERVRHSGLTPRQQGVAEALLLGWRDDLEDSVQQQFRQAGITHLLCVSGLHVGIVAWLAGAALFFLGKKRWQQVVKGLVEIAAIWFFVLLTGMAPATLRAGIMFSLMLTGKVLQRQPNSLNNLATTMWLLLLFRPMLLYDVGFQLSFAAVAGIVVWQQRLRWLAPLLANPDTRWYLWLPRKIWELLCLTTAAQLATLPLVLYHFHQFPLYFFIANLTIVPFAGLLLATVGLMLLTDALPLVCGWVTTCLRHELEAVDSLTRWISSLPHAMLTDIYCNLPMALLLVVAQLLFSLLLVYISPLEQHPA